MNRRERPAPKRNQQEHSTLSRSGRFNAPRSVNRQVRPDLDVPEPMDWQPHASSSGTDHPDLKRNTLFNVPGQQEYPDLKRNTMFDVPGTEGQERPVLSKLTNFEVPGSDRQERPALSQCTAANVPSVVDPSARNDGDIDLEYR
jgi:hypothetical protein